MSKASRKKGLEAENEFFIKLLLMIDGINLTPEGLTFHNIENAFEDAVYQIRHKKARESAFDQAMNEFHSWINDDEPSFFGVDIEQLTKKYTKEILESGDTFSNRDDFDENEIKYELLGDFMREFPQELRDWIYAPLDNPDSYDPYNEAFERYVDLSEWQDVLPSIAKWLNEWNTAPDEYQQRYFLRSSSFNFNSRLRINENNQIEVSFSRIFEHFKGLDARRLKICPKCQRIFWAKRLDMTGCSTSCAKVLRTRNWRNSTTEEQRTQYKLNRIEKELKIERKK